MGQLSISLSNPGRVGPGGPVVVLGWIEVIPGGFR